MVGLTSIYGNAEVSRSSDIHNLDEGRPQDTPARTFASDVLAALHDKDPNVRSAMLNALPSVGPKPKLFAVIKSLLADPSPMIQDDLAYLLTETTNFDAAARLTAGD